MQYLSAQQRTVDLLEYKRGAKEEDCRTLVSESTTVSVAGRVVAVYLTDIKGPIIDQIRAVLPKVSTKKHRRSRGLVTNSRIFGFAPRNRLMNHPCRAVSLAEEQPAIHKVIASGAEVVAKYYEESMPETAAFHRDQTTQRVRPEFRLGGSMFTSGIVNRNNPLQYHFDSGNFNNCCSAMLGFKTDVGGGQLCVPELDIRFEIADRSLLLFDGQGLLHGVTPIIKHSPKAERYTIVYYALKQMWKCESITDELIALRQKRLETEQSMRDNTQVVRSYFKGWNSEKK